MIYRKSRAPAPPGPFNQAVRVDDTLYISGQIGVVLGTSQLADSLEDQVHLIFRYLDEILRVAGARLSNVIKTTVYLSNMSDFADVNAIYASYFPDNQPARAAFEVNLIMAINERLTVTI